MGVMESGWRPVSVATSCNDFYKDVEPVHIRRRLL